MNAPQIIWIVLASITLAVALLKDGQRLSGTYNATSSLLGSVAAVALVWWGGMFDSGMHVPQVVWIVLITFNFTVAATRHGEPKVGRHNFALTAVSLLGIAALLWFGGFFGGGA